MVLAKKHVIKPVDIRRKLVVGAKKLQKKSTKHVEEEFVERLDNVHSVRHQVLAWAAAIAALIFLTGLQFMWFRANYETDSFTAGGVYIEGTYGKVNSLNPIFAATDSEVAVEKLVFSSLYGYDTTGHIKADLAKNTTVSDDGRTYTITIRDDAKWQDGKPVTIDDVYFTLLAIKDPATRAVDSADWQDIEISKKSDSQLMLTLPERFAGFLNTLTFPVLPEHILGKVKHELLYENDFSLHPVGSGPFTFKVMQTLTNQNDKIIHLSANANYYGGRPKLDRFQINTFDQRADILTALKRSEISATAELATSDYTQLDQGRINLRETDISNGVYAFLNTTSPVLKSKSVRQALQKGIDIGIVREALLREVTPLDYPIVPAQMTLNLPARPKFDRTTAWKQLATGGLTYKNGRLLDTKKQQATLRLVTVKNDDYEQVAKAIKKQLEELGFKVVYDVYDSADPTQNFLQAVLRPRNYDILVDEIALGADPDAFAYWHSSQAGENGLNLSNYSNATSDDILTSARTTTDVKLRQVKYESFVKKWLDDVPAIGVYQVRMAYMYGAGLRTFSEDSQLNVPEDRYNDVLYWAVNKSTVLRTP